MKTNPSTPTKSSIQTTNASNQQTLELRKAQLAALTNAMLTHADHIVGSIGYQHSQLLQISDCLSAMVLRQFADEVAYVDDDQLLDKLLRMAKQSERFATFIQQRERNASHPNVS